MNSRLVLLALVVVAMTQAGCTAPSPSPTPVVGTPRSAMDPALVERHAKVEAALEASVAGMTMDASRDTEEDVLRRWTATTSTGATVTLWHVLGRSPQGDIVSEQVRLAGVRGPWAVSVTWFNLAPGRQQRVISGSGPQVTLITGAAEDQTYLHQDRLELGSHVEYALPSYTGQHPGQGRLVVVPVQGSELDVLRRLTASPESFRAEARQELEAARVAGLARIDAPDPACPPMAAGCLTPLTAAQRDELRRLVPADVNTRIAAADARAADVVAILQTVRWDLLTS